MRKYSFTLSVLEGEAPIHIIRVGNAYACGAIDNDGQTTVPSKWPTHELDIREFSRSYPKTLLMLKMVSGRDSDSTIKYFHNGMMRERKTHIFRSVGDFLYNT